MTNVTNALNDQVLQSIQASQADIKADIAGIKKHLALLADGILNIRQDMKDIREDIKALTATVETIALATAGHGRHLSDLEDRLGRIEHHLRVPEGP
jgi:archaellum component FlaC